FGLQLRAKQKLKGYYGNLTEKQFSKIYDEAARRKGNTSENLIGLLESRLDAVVYRAKFVPTPFAARQFVNHGHVLVNGKRVNIPSYRVKPGDVVQVRERSRNMALVLEALQSSERDTPDYITMDGKAMSATYVRIPELAEVPYPVKMEPNLVIEFYASYSGPEFRETFAKAPERSGVFCFGRLAARRWADESTPVRPGRAGPLWLRDRGSPR